MFVDALASWVLFAQFSYKCRACLPCSTLATPLWWWCRCMAIIMYVLAKVYCCHGKCIMLMRQQTKACNINNQAGLLQSQHHHIAIYESLLSLLQRDSSNGGIHLNMILWINSLCLYLSRLMCTICNNIFWNGKRKGHSFTLTEKHL